uniref:Activin_recp domain-containing protein n=1 Tax=Rhabditophanes sp. KR3021 TaxID=114890 RepID=A0AC35TGN0_9BILA
MKRLLLVYILILLVKHSFAQHYSANSVTCILCDGSDEDCMGSSCTGIACVKRSTVINGQVRIQKMCQMSDNGFNALEKCDITPLWQGRIGEECICKSDWCNSSSILNKYLFIYSLSFIILYHFYL